MFLLPQQSHSIIQRVLNSLLSEASFIKFCLIKNIKDDDETILPDMIRPRYLAFYGSKKGEVDQAFFYLRQILGNVFDYEIQEGYGLPPEIDNRDKEKVILLNSFYDRSRIIESKMFIKNFMGRTLSTQDILANILTSTLILQVRSNIINSSKTYDAVFTTKPTMGIVRYNNNLVFTNPLSAVEELCKTYKNVVDVNFDLLQIDYDNDLSVKFHPPESGVELFEIFRRSFLDSSNKEL